jgi:hypothetical protein
MADNDGHDGQEAALGHGGDFGNVLVMIFGEFHRRQQRREVGPAGKGFSVDQQSVRLAVSFDERVYQSAILGD